MVGEDIDGVGGFGEGLAWSIVLIFRSEPIGEIIEFGEAVAAAAGFGVIPEESAVVEDICIALLGIAVELKFLEDMLVGEDKIEEIGEGEMEKGVSEAVEVPKEG